MSVAARPIFAFDNTFVRDLEGLYVRWQGAPVETPVLLTLNAAVAAQLGIDVEVLRSPEGVAALAGSAAPDGAEPVAQAYAGHQFGGYSPRLGDGRALLLGEVVDTAGVRQDIHLKGSGKTPFARAGDGKAAIGPMLREFAISEAMHALGIRTARALAVVATNESVRRDSLLPGAVLTRVAESHLRVGTFEYAAATGNSDLLKRLADYAIARHYPAAADADQPYRELYAQVVAAQADLIAQWMLVGFIHGVMNTDNTTISGQTIDYGPCAFMDRYDTGTVFSSIDTNGRYAYGNQPAIAQWNLARLAETLLSLLDASGDAAVQIAEEELAKFAPAYLSAYRTGLARKLGLDAAAGETAADVELLGEELGTILQREQPDYTSFFRALSAALRGETGDRVAQLPADDEFRTWAARWRELVIAQGRGPQATADAMDRVNPVYIPRNHLVEDALSAATTGDLKPFAEMLGVLSDPYTERDGLEDWTVPASGDDRPYVTFCGT